MDTFCDKLATLYMNWLEQGYEEENSQIYKKRIQETDAKRNIRVATIG